MSDLMNQLKEKNSQSVNRLTKKFYSIVFAMWFIGALLIIINPDQLITFGVLMIFFGFILLMITIFMSAVNASKQMKSKIKNSVDIVYKNYMNQFNDYHNTDYHFDSEDEGNQPWFLVPSFASKDIYYSLKDNDSKSVMYHSNVYSVFGTNQSKTHYFNGLYIIVDDIDGFDEDIQYRDHSKLYQKFISKVTPMLVDDEHQPSRFTNKKELEQGVLYSNSPKNMPQMFESLLELIKSKPYVSSVKLAIQNLQLHIAIEHKNQRIPYVKKHQEEELEPIEKFVEEHAKLFKEILYRMNQFI